MKTSSIVNRAKHLALLLVLLLPAIAWSDTLFDPPPARSRNSIAEPTNPGTGVGSIAADFSVSPSGAATYSIPIKVPPANGGVQPTLCMFSARHLSIFQHQLLATVLS